MTQDDHSRIQVGQDQVGIMGLKAAMAELAESHGHKADEEVQQALLDRLEKKNYIPASARNDYGRAFVREFRKFLGQPHEEVGAGALNIVILGPGCSQCESLVQMVMRVLSETGVPASLEHVTDIKEMAQYGFVRVPALVINGKIATMGTLPSAKKIKELLTAESRAECL
jgi:small redox-active disulfide protein 2